MPTVRAGNVTTASGAKAPPPVTGSDAGPTRGRSASQAATGSTAQVQPRGSRDPAPDPAQPAARPAAAPAPRRAGMNGLPPTARALTGGVGEQRDAQQQLHPPAVD